MSEKKQSISAIREIFAAASETELPALYLEYEADSRAGVQNLIQKYQKQEEALKKERERTEDQIKEANRRLEELEAQMLAGDQRKEIIQRYTHVEHLTREMVEILIDYITVGKRVPGTQDVPIEIYWNF